MGTVFINCGFHGSLYVFANFYRVRCMPWSHWFLHVRTHHMFSRILNFLFAIFFSRTNNIYIGIWFLNQDPFRAGLLQETVKNSSWAVTSFGNKAPLKVLNGTLEMIMGIIWTHLESVCNTSGPSEVPYSTN